jgi:F-type H+-transporting ATPase subunit epsilon
MNGFDLLLQDATRAQRIEGVSDFVAEDASGSFGIRAHHARMITSLSVGLSRYRIGEGAWQYLAMPGAMLYFHDNTLSISTRHFLQDDDYDRITTALQQQLLEEEEEMRATKESLRHMEEEILKRMWELGRRGV